MRTLRAIGAHILVMRHAMSGAPYLAAANCDARVINAGDGWHAHPTQGLLDLYTLRSHIGDLRGKRIVIVGDVAHSRVARSDIWGLTQDGRRGRGLRPADAAAGRSWARRTSGRRCRR